MVREGLPFDRVVVVGESGARGEHSASEFLALPPVQRLDHLLGGKVEFFRGEQPVRRSEALRGLLAPAPSARPDGTVVDSVLVVDDEPAVLESTAAVLSDHYRVFSAGDGRAALDLVCSETIDVICTDYAMPGMTGIQLLERSAALFDHIAGVLVTGYREYVSRSQGNDGSGYLLLFKPYDPRKLIDVVAQVLSAFSGLRQVAAPGRKGKP